MPQTDITHVKCFPILIYEYRGLNNCCVENFIFVGRNSDKWYERQFLLNNNKCLL